MFDEATILARLQNGEDAQTIANEMAAALNKVNKMHQDTLAKQAAEKAAVEKAEVQKKEELQDILDMFCDWFGTYYGMNAEKIKAELKADQVIELVDSLKEYIEAVKGLEAMFGAKPVVKAPVKKIVKPNDPDAVIGNFLKEMGL